MIENLFKFSPEVNSVFIDNAHESDLRCNLVSIRKKKPVYTCRNPQNGKRNPSTPVETFKMVKESGYTCRNLQNDKRKPTTPIDWFKILLPFGMCMSSTNLQLRGVNCQEKSGTS
jgi:hypothetical protein